MPGETVTTDQYPQETKTAGQAAQQAEGNGLFNVGRGLCQERVAGSKNAGHNPSPPIPEFLDMLGDSVPTPKITTDAGPVFFLLALLFLFAELGLFQLNTFSSIVVAPAHWISWIFIAAVTGNGFLIACYRGSIRLSWMALAVVVYLLLVIIAAWGAGYYDPYVRWEWYGFLAGFLFFLALHQLEFDTNRENWLYGILLSAGCLQALVGLAQYHSLSLLNYTFISGYGAIGGFYQTNKLGSFLATTALIGLVLRRSPLNGEGDWWRRLVPVLAGCALLAIGYTLYLTSSRVGLFGLFLGAAVILWGRRVRDSSQESVSPDRPALLLSWWQWLATIVAGYVLAHLLVSGRLFTKLLQFTEPEGMHRSFLYRAAWNLWLEQPWFGHGPGAFGTIFRPAYMKAVGAMDTVVPLQGVITHPHNELLYRLMESGLMGGLGLLSIVAVMLWQLGRLGGHRGWFYAGLLFPLALHTQTEYPLYQSGVLWALFLLLLYLPSRHLTRSWSVAWLQPGRWRTATVITLAAILLYNFAWLVGNFTTARQIMPALLIHRQPALRQQFSRDFVKGILTTPGIQDDSYYAPYINHIKLTYQRSKWLSKAHERKQLQQFIDQLDRNSSFLFTATNIQLKLYALTLLERFDEAYGLWEQIVASGRNSDIGRVLMLNGVKYAMEHEDEANSAVLIDRFVAWVEEQRLAGRQLNAYTYQYKIRLLTKRGRNNDAITLLREALSLYPDDPQLKQWKVRKQ